MVRANNNDELSHVVRDYYLVRLMDPDFTQKSSPFYFLAKTLERMGHNDVVPSKGNMIAALHRQKKPYLQDSDIHVEPLARIFVRPRMVQEGPIYIKPRRGSQAVMIYRASYDSDQEHLVLQTACRPTLDHLLSTLEKIAAPGVEVLCTSEKKGRKAVTLSVSPVGLTGVLDVIARQYTERGSYVEREIQTPLVQGGKTWEVRYISQAKHGGNSGLTAIYCKVGSDDFVSNLSVGGRGTTVAPIVREAYRSLRPEVSPKEISSLASQYIQSVRATAKDTVISIGDYLTALKDEYVPGFPMERVDAMDVALDFMGQTYQGDDGLRLKPILIDINFNYDFLGLRNQAIARRIAGNRRTIENATNKVFGSLLF